MNFKSLEKLSTQARASLVATAVSFIWVAIEYNRFWAAEKSYGKQYNLAILSKLGIDLSDPKQISDLTPSDIDLLKSESAHYAVAIQKEVPHLPLALQAFLLTFAIAAFFCFSDCVYGKRTLLAEREGGENQERHLRMR